MRVLEIESLYPGAPEEVVLFYNILVIKIRVCLTINVLAILIASRKEDLTINQDTDCATTRIGDDLWFALPHLRAQLYRRNSSCLALPF